MEKPERKKGILLFGAEAAKLAGKEGELYV